MTKVCFPVFQNHGISSLVSSQFDAAPLCVIVDITTHTVIEVANRNARERHGLCRELVRRCGVADVAFVVDGIGASALAELRKGGFAVYQAQPSTLADNLERLVHKELVELTKYPVSFRRAQPAVKSDDDPPEFGCGF